MALALWYYLILRNKFFDDTKIASPGNRHSSDVVDPSLPPKCVNQLGLVSDVFAADVK